MKAMELKVCQAQTMIYNETDLSIAELKNKHCAESSSAPEIRYYLFSGFQMFNCRPGKRAWNGKLHDEIA